MMNRLQKKCFIATSTFHGVLVGVLLFGSALMPEHKEVSNVKLLTAIDPAAVTAALTSGGGDPEVKVPLTPPPAAPEPKTETPPPPIPQPKPLPPVAKPEPKPEPKVEPLPKIEPPKIIHPVHNDLPKLREEKAPKTKPKLDPKDLTPVTPKTPHRVVIDPNGAKLTQRDSNEQAKAAQEAAREAARAQARAESRRKGEQVAQVLQGLKHDLSSATLIHSAPGPGNSGPVSINYDDLIFNKYYHAWIFPPGADDSTPSVTATVTISRSGSIKSAHIIKHSGNTLMDKSVQNALNNVTYIEPFPDGMSDSERTVTIIFDPRAKQQTG